MSDIPASAPTVDLSSLPPPTVVAPLSFEAILANLIADFRTRLPDFDALLESDPISKLMEAFAYRELLTRADANDQARSVMPAFAKGANLDQIVARLGLTRLVVTPATDAAPAVMERDEDLLRRYLLSPELMAIGMTAGGYEARVRTVAPSVKDVSVINTGGGGISIVLLGRDGDGTVPPETVGMVAAAFAGEDATQLTDIVTVSAATILPYSATLTLWIRPGPAPIVVQAAAMTAARAYAAGRHMIGRAVYADMLRAAAASVGGIERASIDIGDVDPGPRGAAWLETLSVDVEVIA
ncbi:baseplate assembly protein [Sphingomonas sp. PR090111-T3T-6A]|uniref:baseplate assembly protein n=1 Tax=Sphingomonas sp. PR090111-T3T-6A TaxID=685778 RepID=UPI000372B453|nr:baseplate J/gp47 family protein [Sphingomonas sp. PR090111-T3T-6A]